MTAGHIRQRSPGSWELRYPRPRGLGGTRHTGTETFHGGKRQAEARLRELMRAVDTGQDVAPSRITVGAWTSERIALWRSMSRITGRTKESYETLAKLIETYIGAIELQRLTTLDIEAWHGHLRQRGLSATTVQKANLLLGHVLAEAQRHNIVTRNVAREQRPPRGTTARITVPTVDQIPPLLASLHGTEFHAPAVLTIYTGLRRGELLALRWSDIGLTAGTLRVTRALEETASGGITIKSPKTAAGVRTISLPAATVEALRDHRRQQLETRLALGAGKPPDDALVFPALDGRPQSPRAFTQRWMRLSRRLGRGGVRWHALRHLHASLLVYYGVDLSTVATRLGHAQIDTTLRVYTHQVTPDDRHAADALERLG